VAVLSEGAWRKYFAADPNIVNRTIQVDGQVRTVIGVAPKRFAWFTGSVWIPDQSNFVTPANPRGDRYMQGRLRKGVPIARANAELAATGKRLQAAYPALYPKKMQVRGVYSIDDLVGPPFRVTLYTLAGAVFMLLLIACSNVANMLLSRATARYREIGVRMALGAGRLRIVRQLLIEALLLAAGGAAVRSASPTVACARCKRVLPPNGDGRNVYRGSRDSVSPLGYVSSVTPVENIISTAARTPVFVRSVRVAVVDLMPHSTNRRQSLLASYHAPDWVLCGWRSRRSPFCNSRACPESAPDCR